MFSLKDKDWKSFCIEDIFRIAPGVRLTKSNMDIGTRPFVGASDSNNGITAFVSNTNESLDNNVLGVNYNGSVVESFYHPYQAIFTDDVKRFHLRDYQDNKYVLLFLKAVILKQQSKYQYGYKFNENRMKRQSIMLPVTSKGKPDYVFMEQYMLALEKNLSKKYYDRLEQKPMKKIKVNNHVHWKVFFISEIADIKSGQDIYDRERITGNTPYITATAEQNGIGYFVGNNNSSLDKDCLSVNRNGSVGYAFYHPYLALYGNDTRKLVPKVKNKYVGLFLACSISKQRHKYGYGLKMGTGRLYRQRIMLPATSDGKPDYEYMENYMKNQERFIMQQYISMKNKKEKNENAKNAKQYLNQ